jgi:hypothetical protein
VLLIRYHTEIGDLRRISHVGNDIMIFFLSSVSGPRMHTSCSLQVSDKMPALRALRARLHTIKITRGESDNTLR